MTVKDLCQVMNAYTYVRLYDAQCKPVSEFYLSEADAALLEQEV